MFQKFVTNENNILCDVTATFFGESTFDLKLDLVNRPFDSANARASDRDIRSGVISINFNLPYVNENCEFNIMRTLIHEMIHAELHAFVADPEVDVDNFANVYESYRVKKDWQHEAMADWFRDRMTLALKEIYGDQYTDQEYDAFSWQGLDEYLVEDYLSGNYFVPVSQAWADLPRLEKEEIRAIQENLKKSCNGRCD